MVNGLPSLIVFSCFIMGSAFRSSPAMGSDLTSVGGGALGSFHKSMPGSVEMIPTGASVNSFVGLIFTSCMVGEPSRLIKLSSTLVIG